jgi:hypothetical protein
MRLIEICPRNTPFSERHYGRQTSTIQSYTFPPIASCIIFQGFEEILKNRRIFPRQAADIP